ncbi:Rab GTPase-binding exocyst subunit SEC15 [Saccharomyces eubayanus]|uniref:Rab GTPase-binding exocyst subunit SEC15 n=1 Tax=Saccharomyces eubayanus TaxID=1080349 RepID=UPI0006BF9DFE|nr:SEC15-like protein [Saccharomyces eubayanus]KOG99301.1 SEC15-like protein [Saccharomyces eubayanus]
MDQEGQPLLSKEFQQVLLATASGNNSSWTERTSSSADGNNAVKHDPTLEQNDVFDLDPQSFDKWVPFLRSSLDENQLEPIIDELENSIEDNFQGLELQLLQDSQMNDKLETSIDEIANIQNMVQDTLSSEISKFQMKLTESSNELIVKKQLYVNNKKISLKISEATILITKVVRILELSSKCQELITERKFFKVLQNLDSLEKLYLQEFKNYNFQFLIEIYNSIPFLQKVTKDECINLIRNSLNLNLGKNLIKAGQEFLTIYKEELLPQWLETRSKMKLTNFKFNSPVEISMRDESSMAKLNLNEFFQLDDFHDSIMIFQNLNELNSLFSEFNKEYELRKTKLMYPLIWKKNKTANYQMDSLLRGTGTTSGAPGHDISTDDAFTQSLSLSFLQDYFLRILGFLLYDINLNKATEFILVDNNYNSTNEFWDGLMDRLAPYLKYYIDKKLETEADMITLKDFLCIYVAILENFKLNIEPLYKVLISIFNKFCSLSLKAFDDEFQILLNDDDFMPLSINDKTLYEKVLKICWMKEDERPNLPDPMSGEPFSVTLPFSPLYPMTCTLAKKTYSKLTAFLSTFYRHELHTLNNILVNLMDDIFNDIVNKKIRSKLESTSREEIAQILINLDYFIIAAKEFSNFMTRENILQNPDMEIRLSSIKHLAESRKLAETKLIELIDSKISDILETIEIDWQIKECRRDPDISIIDLAQFLEMMFASTLQNLPYSVQTLLIFREFDSLTRQFMDILLHDTPSIITHDSVTNFEVDINYLESIIPRIFPSTPGVIDSNGYQSPMTPSTPTFPSGNGVDAPTLFENNIKSLEATFMELKQCIELLKAQGRDYNEPEIRLRKYSRIRQEDAALLLSKIQPSAPPTDGGNDDDNSTMDSSSIFNSDSVNGMDSSTSRIAKFFNRR